MKDRKRIVLIVIACLLLLLSVPLLFSRKPAAEQPSELGKGSETAHSDKPIGELKLGMSMDEVESLLGEAQLVTDGDEIRWSYEALNITFHSFNERVSEIRALTGCSFTLGSGIGLGSTLDDVMEAYPQAYETEGDLDIDKVNSWVHVDDLDDSLQIGVTDGIVSVIIWKDYGNPLLEALTVNEIILYTAEGIPVQAIDKAAKRICTTITISEPEEAPIPDGTPIGWMDFGDGTAVCLYEGDYAVVFRYDDTFDPETTQALKIHLEGIFLGLGDAFAQALQNPSETW